MQIVKPTYYVKYTKENDSDNEYYKKVDTCNPYEIKYEDGMYDFAIQKMFNCQIGGQEVYVVLEPDKKKYAFGEVDSVDNLLKRVTNGEYFAEDYTDMLEFYKNSTGMQFFVSGKRALGYAKYDGYVKIDDKKHDLTPDVLINKDNLVNANNSWYVEYKKVGDSKLYYKPTFCNDKKFRFDNEIESYRFVKVANFMFNNNTYQVIYEMDDELHKVCDDRFEQDVVDEAIDGAKRLIYKEHSQSDHMFNGYTPVYHFNTENIASVFKKQEDYIINDDVLTVTGSGDSLIDLFLYGAKSVTCFDTNYNAKYFAKLKFSAIKAGLSFEEFLYFIQGKKTGDEILSYDIYKKFAHTLDKDTRKFWDGVYAYLNVSGMQMKNNEHSLLYTIMSYFGSSNCSYGNPNSYCTKENYDRVQKILQTKTEEDIKFIDAPLFDLDKKIKDRKFNYIYLSNIMDFTSTFIENKELADRLNIFKSYVLNILSGSLKDNGIMDVAFIFGRSRMSEDIYLDLNEYAKIFEIDENFVIQDLCPYNNDDHVITFYNKKLDNNYGRPSLL